MVSVDRAWDGIHYGEQADMRFCVSNYASQNANIDAMTIQHNGNVGIGTTSPGHKLEVEGNINIKGTIYQNGVEFVGGGGGGGGGGYWTQSGSKIYYNSGNVGIGTTSPVTKLHVHNGSTSTDSSNDYGNTYFTLSNTQTGISRYRGFQMTLGYDKSGTINLRENGPLKFTVNGSDRMIITANGNVGINNNNPQEKLDVDGNILIRAVSSADSGGSPFYTEGRGIFFRPSFTPNSSDGGDNYVYNTSITAFAHDGLHADGIRFAGYDGLSFMTGDQVERIRIVGGTGSDAGNVGIGTTSPRHKLEISDGLNYPYSSSHNHYKEIYAALNINTSSWAAAIKIVGSHSNTVGVYDLYNTQSSSWTGNSRTDGATFNRWSHFSKYGDLYFRYYYDSGQTNNYRNVLVLKHDGNVGIGITNPRNKITCTGRY